MQPLNGGLTVRRLVGRLRERRRAATLLGIGPVSETTVRAAVELAREKRFPPMFVASRNQVDCARLGGGYLLGGTDQAGFVALIRRLAGEAGYEGPLYVCRDHGGPWQRNRELEARLPAGQAMEAARESFAADLAAGFNYIHVDPTKCPHPHGPEDLGEWTVELIRFCETRRAEAGLAEVDYEVGAEDIRGGYTPAAFFEQFLSRTTARLRAEGLPPPTCIVGQTGTLTRLDRNVGRFDAASCRELVQAAARHGVGFKEHNGDYLNAASCRAHPRLGITAMNVAPEFGLVETDALLALEELEQKLVGEGRLPAPQASGLGELLREAAFARAPWPKWMTEEILRRPREALAADDCVRRLITRVCGHYVYHEPRLRSARERLAGNVNRFGLVPGPGGAAEGFILSKVKAAIGFYVGHFRLEGINDLLDWAGDGQA